MAIFLGIAGVLSFLLGLMAFIGAESTFHETTGSILSIGGLLLVGMAHACDLLHSIRKIIKTKFQQEQVSPKTHSKDLPTFTPEPQGPRPVPREEISRMAGKK